MRRIPLPVIATAALVLSGACGQQSRPLASAAPPTGLSRSQELLLAASSVALPPDWIGPGDLPAPDSRGARLMVAYCRQCHALPTPRAHGTADWPVVARRMWLRMEGLPESLRVQVPTLAERSEILEYLTANALKVNSGPLPPGKGREAFVLLCSRCHAAPDPGLHTAEQWPVVLARVERNMRRMNVYLPTGMESEDILSYLQTVATSRRAAGSASQ